MDLVVFRPALCTERLFRLHLKSTDSFLFVCVCVSLSLSFFLDHRQGFIENTKKSYIAAQGELHKT